MMNFSKYFTLFFTIILLFASSGCQTIQVRGQFVTDEAIEEINRKKPQKNEVVSLIGSPTYTPEYTQQTWYYIQRSLSSRAWFNPKVAEQRIVKITFDERDRTIEALLLKDMHNENITSNADFTKTHGTEKNAIQKFVKNIGRFNKTTDANSRSSKKKK